MTDVSPHRQVTELLAAQTLAVLATQGEAGPHASLVGFAPTADGCGLYFATSRDTRKYANLIAASRAALLIDNRGGADPSPAITATGPVTEASDSERENGARLLAERQPPCAEFLARPECAVMRMQVEAFRLARSIDDVITLRVGS